LGLECRGLAQHPVDRRGPGDLPEQRGDEWGQRLLHDHVSESRNLHLSVCGSRGGHDRADRRPVVTVGGLLPWRRHPPHFSGLGNAMPTALPEPSQLNTPELLEAFFERSQDGFFFMMLDQPVEWGRGSGVDKDAVLDYVFSHQRMTKVNPAMAQQFRAKPAELIGMTPRDFFRHDLAAGRRGWRKLFDAGHTHSLTNERRLDGSMMCEPAAFQAQVMLSPAAIVSTAGFVVPLWALRKKMLPTKTSPTGWPPPPGEVTPPHPASSVAASINGMCRMLQAPRIIGS